MIKRLFVSVLLIVVISNAQEFFVEYQKIEGELTSKDLQKENFGRYDGYQLPLNKGERANFLVYSEDFSPSLVLVTPDDKKYQQAQGRGDDFVSMNLKVPETGEWVLYVLGDSSAKGSYLLQYAFADSASIFLNQQADFCTGIQYLLSHATAYFIFPQTIPSSNALYKIEGALDVFINGDDGSYNATIYEGDSLEEAKELFNEMKSKLKGCLPSSWKLALDENEEEIEGVESFAAWTENVRVAPRIVRLTLLNNSEMDSDVEYPNDYTLELMLMRY